MNVFQDTLRRIAERVEGTQVVSLIGVDGIPIDSYGPADRPEFESVAAELGAFAKSIQSPRTHSDGGKIEEIVLVTDLSTAIVLSLILLTVSVVILASLRDRWLVSP